MEILLNPSNIATDYLHYLNTCFPGWGTMTNYDWAFNRTSQLSAADLFLINDNGETIAGSALTYRVLNLPNNEQRYHGTMTGSWTLPNARGKGCFSRMIEASLEVIQQRQYHILSAYVTATNASFRRLKAAGAILIPTQYINASIPTEADDAYHIPLQEIKVLNSRSYKDLYMIRNQNLLFACHYAYTLEQFIRQYIQRPEGASIVLKYKDHYFILSETPTTYRILYSTSYSLQTLELLRHWAALNHKNIFFFTTRIIEELHGNSDYTITPGYFTMQGVSPEIHKELESLSQFSYFHIEYGDKM